MARVGFKTKAVKEQDRQDGLPVRVKKFVDNAPKDDDGMLNRITQVGLMKTAERYVQKFMATDYPTSGECVRAMDELTNRLMMLKNLAILTKH